MRPVDRRYALRAAAATALAAASTPGGAQEVADASKGGNMTYRHPAPGAVPRELTVKVGEIVSITDFGALGDHISATKPGTDNATAILAALDASPDVYLPAGRYRFTSYPALRRVIDATCYGPGQLYYDNGKQTELIGSVLRVGVCDPDGNLGALSQGGIVVGGEGPGVHGSLLYGPHPAWPVIQPTRAGSAMEFQIYNFAHLGAARRVPGTGFIDAVYGDFASPNIEAGDVVGYGDRLYVIAAKVSQQRLELKSRDGQRVQFNDDVTSVYRHAYYYGDGICSCDGNVVTRIGGDNFFDIAVLDHQKTISFGGKRFPIERVESTERIVLAQTASAQTAVPFVVKMLPLSLNVSLLRLQGLIGGSEETFFIAETLDGVVRMRAGGHGHGTYRPVIVSTGPDQDFGYHTDHLVISKSGQIGIGRNYANPDRGFPTAAKLHVWRDGTKPAVANAANDVALAVFETNHAGPAPRQIRIGSYNNYHAGYIQGYVDQPGTLPGALAINPAGGPVAIATGTTSAITHALEVNGTVAPHQDGKAALGAATHRWSTVYAATGIVQTSDATEKQDFATVPVALIEAFLDIEPKLFRWRASAAEKGDSARQHLGYVAQELAAALTARGLDPARYGVWCRDELTNVTYDAVGALSSIKTGTERQALRYDQLLTLIDAANRHRYALLESRLRVLEARL